LVKSGAYPELLLAAAPSAPSPRPTELKGITEALAKGCAATAGSDAALAQGLAERAMALRPSPPAALCLAHAAQATSQLTVAEEALRQGLKVSPRHAALHLALAKVLLLEGDTTGAEVALRAIPKSTPEQREAKHLLSQLRSRPPPKDKSPPSASLSFESGTGPGDLRTRTNALFAIKYFNNQRDFGQRAAYEQRVTDALGEAHDFAKRILGRAREHPVDVVLYTRDEFRLHFGAGTSRVVAGLYAEDAIRMNDAAELTPAGKATLVHEYVHAVIDDLNPQHGGQVPTWLNEGTARYVEWRYQGVEGPSAVSLGLLRTAVRGHALPTLQELSQGALISKGGNPDLTYSESAIAVRVLIRRGGVEELLKLLEDLEAGTPQEAALKRHYAIGLDQLQRDVDSTLTGN
jgi:hypothetical protein